MKWNIKWTLGYLDMPFCRIFKAFWATTVIKIQQILLTWWFDQTILLFQIDYAKVLPKWTFFFSKTFKEHLKLKIHVKSFLDECLISTDQMVENWIFKSLHIVSMLFHVTMLSILRFLLKTIGCSNEYQLIIDSK